jgi:hypothetical protein
MGTVFPLSISLSVFLNNESLSQIHTHKSVSHTEKKSTRGGKAKALLPNSSPEATPEN